MCVCLPRNHLPVIVFFMMLLTLGCGQSQEATVSGKVTLDGDPLDHGSVIFVAGSKTKADSAAGDIKPDGTYLVQIGQSGKMLCGEYQVAVTARSPSQPHPMGGPPMPGELTTPARYADATTSGLRFMIRPGENTIDIPLVSDAPEADEAVSQEGPVQGDSAASESHTADETADEGLSDSVEESDDKLLPESSGAPSEQESGEGNETT